MKKKIWISVATLATLLPSILVISCNKEVQNKITDGKNDKLDHNEKELDQQIAQIKLKDEAKNGYAFLLFPMNADSAFLRKSFNMPLIEDINFYFKTISSDNTNALIEIKKAKNTTNSQGKIISEKIIATNVVEFKVESKDDLLDSFSDFYSNINPKLKDKKLLDVSAKENFNDLMSSDKIYKLLEIPYEEKLNDIELTFKVKTIVDSTVTFEMILNQNGRKKKVEFYIDDFNKIERNRIQEEIAKRDAIAKPVIDKAIKYLMEHPVIRFNDENKHLIQSAGNKVLNVSLQSLAISQIIKPLELGDANDDRLNIEYAIVASLPDIVRINISIGFKLENINGLEVATKYKNSIDIDLTGFGSLEVVDVTSAIGQENLLSTLTKDQSEEVASFFELKDRINSDKWLNTDNSLINDYRDYLNEMCNFIIKKRSIFENDLLLRSLSEFANNGIQPTHPNGISDEFFDKQILLVGWGHSLLLPKDYDKKFYKISQKMQLLYPDFFDPSAKPATIVFSEKLYNDTMAEIEKLVDPKYTMFLPEDDEYKHVQYTIKALKADHTKVVLFLKIGEGVVDVLKDLPNVPKSKVPELSDEEFEHFKQTIMLVNIDVTKKDNENPTN